MAMDEELQVLSATFFITFASLFHRANFEPCVKVLFVHGCLANYASRSSPLCDRNAYSPFDHVDFRSNAGCRKILLPSRADRLGGCLSDCFRAGLRLTKLFRNVFGSAKKTSTLETVR
jgi:hypothetical protein